MNSPATSAGARNCSIDTKRHARQRAIENEEFVDAALSESGD
jgi:hypothetical protein